MNQSLSQLIQSANFLAKLPPDFVTIATFFQAVMVYIIRVETDNVFKNRKKGNEGGSKMTQQNNPVNWFEIPVKDLEKAKAFYETVLSYELSINEMGPLKMAWFPMFQGATGAAGTLVQAEGYVPSHHGSMVYFSVDSIEGSLEKINANGGKTLTPKTSIGEHGFVAHFEDCEGNRVALHALK